MAEQRLELVGLDRLRYFAPTAMCLYLGVLCVVLIVTSAFLVSLQNAVAVTAAGLFGLCLSAALGMLFWTAQRRDLRYVRVAGAPDAAVNYAAVRAAALQAGWTLVCDEPAQRLDALTAVLLLSVGERVAVRFRGAEVWVASICDPSVGFSLVGRRHCAQHRERVLRAVSELVNE